MRWNEMKFSSCPQRSARHYQDDWKDFLMWPLRCGSWAITILCIVCSRDMNVSASGVYDIQYAHKVKNAT